MEAAHPASHPHPRHLGPEVEVAHRLVAEAVLVAVEGEVEVPAEEAAGLVVAETDLAADVRVPRSQA